MISDRPTVLLMMRGERLLPMEVEMARELSADHIVVVMCAPELETAFAGIEGIIIRPHVSRDILWRGRMAPVDVNHLRRRAREIEDELGVPMYATARNFLLYGRFIRAFGGPWSYLTTEAETLAAFVGAYDRLIEVFDETSPDVVFYEAVDLISNYLALEISRHRGIFAFDLRPSPLGEGLGSLGYGTERRNVILEHLYSRPELISTESLSTAEEILEEPEAALYGSFWARRHREMIPAGSSGRRFRVPQVQQFGTALRNRRWHLRIWRNRRWLKRHLSTDLPRGRYVVFFLSHMPEASTCSQAPRWVDQDSVIEQIAVNAPSDIRIVVKEHPRTFGRRGREFFKPLEALPNVTLCHPKVSNGDLVQNAEGVFTTTGTAGFEAILLNQRVGVLGRPFYSIFEGVCHLDHPDEAFRILRPEFDPDRWKERRTMFLAAYLQSLSTFGTGRESQFFSQQSGRGWGAALRKALEFVRLHSLQPADFIRD